MTLWIKQSTARTIHIGPFLDDTDGKTAETALTLTQGDIRLSKNGGDIAQKSTAGTLTHDELGYYTCSLSATDTNTLGHLKLAVHESGALPVFMDMMVVPANVWDSMFSTDNLQVDVVQLNGGATSGNNATLSLKSISVVNASGDAVTFGSSGTNGRGFYSYGNGSGHGMYAKGGATGKGFMVSGGSTSGEGLYASAIDGDAVSFQAGSAGHYGLYSRGYGAGAGIYGCGGSSGVGIYGQGNSSAAGIHGFGGTSGMGIYGQGSGVGAGIKADGGATGHGIHAHGGATSGHGIFLDTHAGDGLRASADGSGHGIFVKGDSAGDGFRALAGSTGDGMRLLGGSASGTGLKASSTDGDGILAIGAGSGHGDINAHLLPSVSTLVASDVWTYGTRTLTAGGAPSVASIADAVWDELTASHTSTGSYGKTSEWAGGSAPSAASVADAVWAEAARTLTDYRVASMADAVWEELTASHTSTGTYGNTSEWAGGTSVSAASIADEVWNELTASHTTTGSFGKLLNDAATVDDVANAVWDEMVASHTTSLSAGDYLYRYLYNVHNLVDTAITDIGTVNTKVNTIDGNVVTIGNDVQSATYGLSALHDDIAHIHTNHAPASVASIADGVWNELTASHTSAGSYGNTSEWAGSGGATAASVADAVWNELAASHTTAGSFGLFLTTAKKWLTNKMVVTTTAASLYDDDSTTVLSTQTLADTGTKITRGKAT